MTTARSTTRHTDQTQHHDRELERTIRDALVLAAGKRAANQALRHARNKARGTWRRRLGRVAGHTAGYGALLAYIWRLRRTPKHSPA
jgi:ferric-dicitrate binding protein FerR (iron transport regulator)